MLEIEAGGQECQILIDGSERWSLLKPEKLIITSEYLKYGDIEINNSDIQEAVYNQYPWPHKVDTLVFHAEHGKYLFNFKRLPIGELTFPFEVVKTKVNPFKATMNKLWLLILLIFLLRFLLDFWKGYTGY